MIEHAFWALAAPVAIAAVILILGWRPWSRADIHTPSWQFTVCAPLAITSAFAASFVAVDRSVHQLPLERWEYCLPLVVGIAIVAIFNALIRGRWWPQVRATGLVLVAGLVTAWLLKLPDLNTVAIRLGLGGAVVLLTMALVLADGKRLRYFTGALVITTIGAATLASGFERIGFVSLATGVAIGLAGVVQRAGQERQSVLPACVIMATSTVALAATGHGYDDGLPTWMFLVPPLSLLVLPLTSLRPLARRPFLTAGVVSLVVVIACGSTLVPAARILYDDLSAYAQPESSSSPYDEWP